METSRHTNRSLYILLISVHGLIRGRELELGRDADTGGQTKYVVELTRALAQRPDVSRVDLVTRLVSDSTLCADYAQPVEDLCDGSRIIRIAAGPDEYIAKEQLWDHLDSFADNTLQYLNSQQDRPNLIHSHYADGGYVGSRLSLQLGIPLVHTGHSLGRVKRRRLLAAGFSAEEIEQRFNMSRRVEAEEQTLSNAERVITSTHQEIEEQYGLYDYYHPDSMRVIPPGTDLTRFFPPGDHEWQTHIGLEIRRFLREPDKPFILALSRPDSRKNIGNVISAYAENNQLNELANLVIVAGNRDDISDMEDGAREVLTDLLLLIDRYDLYGKVALPKHHSADDVPIIYRLATANRGVFVNPALTEPFGLTLIEAAASGLPIVATEDGGPRDIIANCRNGTLIDPLDTAAIGDALLNILANSELWQELANNGVQGVRENYSWKAHARRYLDTVRPVIDRTEKLIRTPRKRRAMLYHDRAIFTDLDQNLLGDPSSIPEFVSVIRDFRKCATFGIATGRRLDSALKVLRTYGIPEPDVLITSAGTQIHYAPELTADTSWRRHIDYHWTPHIVHSVIDELPGLKLQPKTEQSRYKISYFYDPQCAPSIDEIHGLLSHEEQSVNLIFSFGQFLDVLPIRASKGLALRYFANRWDIPLEQVMVAGGSGADEDMMRGNTLAVVVANRHDEELSQLIDVDRIYFAKQPYARGILEALDHYDFYDSCDVPQGEIESVR